MTTCLDIHRLFLTLHMPGMNLAVLNNVWLSVKTGERHGIVGESGSGKTMLAMTLLGLPPDSAIMMADRYRISGMNMIGTNFEGIRGRRIAMIFQDPAAALNPVFTVGYQIDRVLHEHTRLSARDRKRRALQWLKDVRLPDPEGILKLYPHQLSGGMQQRVLIAMALSAGAELLVADEPTTALDVTVQSEILALLSHLRKTRNLTILLISHDLGVIRQCCSHASVMHQGSIVETGRVEDLLNQPRHPYTESLITAVPGRTWRGKVKADR